MIIEGMALLNNSSPLDLSYVYFLYKSGVIQPEVYQLFLSRENDANSANHQGLNLFTYLLEELPNKLENLSEILEIVAVLSSHCKVNVITREVKNTQEEEEFVITYNNSDLNHDYLKWNVLYGKNLLQNIFRREVLENVLHRSSKNPDYDFFIKLLTRVKEAVGNQVLLRWLLMKNKQDLAPLTCVFQFPIPSKACALFGRMMEVCDVSVGFLYAFRQECIQHWDWEDNEMGQKEFYMMQQLKIKEVWLLSNRRKGKSKRYDEKALKGISECLFGY